MSTRPSDLGFLATHRVPAPGLETYPAPDPSAAAGPRLDTDLDVQVLEQREDGWAHLACSNGWTAWGDGRLLLPLTRFVPASGLMTFAAPDPSQSPGNQLDGGLDLSVVEQRPDGWARILCSNGWSAWADGRLLLDMPPTAALDHAPAQVTTGDAGARPSAGSGQSAYSSSPPDRRADRGGPGYAGSVTAGTADLLYTRWLPVVAGTLLVVGSLIPWFRVLGTGVSAWRVSFLFLTYVDTNSQPRVGLVLVLVAAVMFAYALVPLAGGRPLPRRVLLVSALLAVEVPLLAIQRLLHHNTGIGLHLGPFLVLAGGVLAYVCFWRTRPVGRPGRWSWL